MVFGMKRWKAPSKLIFKIWFCILLPTLLILAALIAVLSLFFNSYYTDNAVEDAAAETENVASRFHETYNYILKRYINLTVSDDFRSTVKNMLSADSDAYSEYNNSLQESFDSYMNIHELICAVLIAQPDITGKESLYYPYTLSLKRYAEGIVGNCCPTASGISFLPSQTSPFNRLGEVIPMAFPLTYVSSSNYILLSEAPGDADLFLYLYLDTEEVHNFLRLYCNDASEGILYLASGDGEILSLTQGSEEYSQVSQEETEAAVRSLIAGNESYRKLKEYHIFCSPVLDGSLYLVNVVPESLFLEDYIHIRSILMVIGITSLLMITVLSVLLSFFITKPLKKLMNSLHDIENGSYRGKIRIQSNDEIEQLNNAIDSMYNTIQKQIERIKQEETLKYNAQMQLLFEQINPHFLYNALEFINMEIVSGHNDNASLMINNLGNYLRTGLAYGENLIPLSKEVEHAVSYINIMSYRFSQSIQVTVEIPEELMSRPIVKCILQPLVENSLKHGFKIGTTGGFPIVPLITISASLSDDCLNLTVTDNGVGIDTDRAEQSVKKQHKNSDGSGHVGLNNVFLRLKSYYTKADIVFSTVPFFENKVTIILPARYFTARQEDSNDQQTMASGT